jgi:2,5-diketo-D-gluconate reductase A
MTTHPDTRAIPNLGLNDGNQIPQLGFGVFQVPPEDTTDAVLCALKTGYRAIDTAAMYENESGVADGIDTSGLDRGEVFVTTKLGNDDHGSDPARRAFEASLERLRTDYVDLYLIHWPIPSQDKYVETWQALGEFKDAGRARSIGVSNFQVEHLERIIEETGVTPAVNQIELHPRFQQSELRAFHKKHGILTEAWSPLAQAALLDDPKIGEVAAAVGRTPAQVILRWHVQLGNVVIPKSVTPERIEENFRIFDFELDADRMRAIGELDSEDGRTGPHPLRFP